MDSNTLKQIVATETEAYAGPGLNGIAYFISNEAQQVYAVADVGEFSGERINGLGLLARIEDDCVIIEHDANDKILCDALVQAGISRSRIVLAYVGESLSDLKAPVEVRFSDENVYVTLSDGRIIGNPLTWYPWLAEATPDQLKNFTLHHQSVSWPELCEELDVESMIKGVVAHPITT